MRRETMQTKELQGSLAVLGALIFDQLDPNLLCSLHQTTQSPGAQVPCMQNGFTKTTLTNSSELL